MKCLQLIIPAGLYLMFLTGCCTPKKGGIDPAWIPATPVREVLAQAQAEYFRSASGEPNDLNLTIEKLETIVKADPGLSVARAYLGAVLLLGARDEPAVLEKLEMTRRGLEALDRSVRDEPGNAQCRALRGVTYWNLPRAIGRFAQARSDLAEVAGASGASDVPRPLLAMVHYLHGLDLDSNDRHEEARASWRRAVETAPESRAAELAEGELGKKKGGE